MFCKALRGLFKREKNSYISKNVIVKNEYDLDAGFEEVKQMTKELLVFTPQTVEETEEYIDEEIEELEGEL